MWSCLLFSGRIDWRMNSISGPYSCSLEIRWSCRPWLCFSRSPGWEKKLRVRSTEGGNLWNPTLLSLSSWQSASLTQQGGVLICAMSVRVQNARDKSVWRRAGRASRFFSQMCHLEKDGMWSISTMTLEPFLFHKHREQRHRLWKKILVDGRDISAAIVCRASFYFQDTTCHWCCR